MRLGLDALDLGSNGVQLGLIGGRERVCGALNRRRNGGQRARDIGEDSGLGGCKILNGFHKFFQFLSKFILPSSVLFFVFQQPREVILEYVVFGPERHDELGPSVHPRWAGCQLWITLILTVNNT